MCNIFASENSKTFVQKSSLLHVEHICELLSVFIMRESLQFKKLVQIFKNRLSLF